MKNIKIKHKKLLLIIGILFGITLIIGTSYAVFSIRHENSSNQIISTGDLELTYNSCTTMTTDMVPMSNEDGLAQTGCNVTIENTGTLDALYKVLIYNNPSGSNLLNHDNLYISIDNSIPVLLSTITKLESTDKYNLKEDIILVGDTRTHNIKIWIKEDATTDIIGKNINFIVDIEAEVAPELAFLASEPLTNPTVTSIFWGGPIGRDTVEEISFATTNEVPAGVIGSWDVGEEKNGEVMAWYTDTDNNSKYEVVVGARGLIYAPKNSSYLFSNFRNLNSLNLTNINTSSVINMSNMFNYAGNDSTVFTLNLGDNFDTSNVTNMYYMFNSTGRNSTSFTLDLGDKFDTTNVTTMENMFGSTGYNSTSFTLDLGDKFNTSNVTTMSSMFNSTGRTSTTFTLDLGNKFDTSNVTNMQYMFAGTGYSSTTFTLDLGDKFDTSKVTTMFNMFLHTGSSSTVFTLDLGDKFDTSKVTNMGWMFDSTGYSSSVFTLDLGDKFDTSKVSEMWSMFNGTGYSNPNFTLDLREFNFSVVTSSSNVFKTGKTTHKLYASASNISFMSGKGFTGTIINCATTPASCPQ